MGFAHVLRSRIPVNVHRGANIGMPHQFLLHSNRRPDRVNPGDRVGASKPPTRRLWSRTAQAVLISACRSPRSRTAKPCPACPALHFQFLFCCALNPPKFGSRWLEKHSIQFGLEESPYDAFRTGEPVRGNLTALGPFQNRAMLHTQQFRGFGRR
jgi:hypothetical protein